MTRRETLTWKQLINYAVFGIAMAYFEASVVVYLRLLYYPEGFSFPLKIIPMNVAVVELGRELSTLVMLWFAARLLRARFRERFIVFIFIFGVWDLFYYFWLKVLLNWPSAWLEWDILFLIPAPWVGPWLAPALVSVGFIAATILLWLKPHKFDGKVFTKKVWAVEILAAILILVSFFWQTSPVVKGEIPTNYPWWLFGIAYLTGLGTFLWAYSKE
ncbi:MAG: hypothetical protein GXO77_15000 [Calditrichaeota bacterium]|nr:hypothetical protein [Calditrichota bacterium]